jgi:hypothetical protein
MRRKSEKYRQARRRVRAAYSAILSPKDARKYPAEGRQRGSVRLIARQSRIGGAMTGFGETLKPGKPASIAAHGADAKVPDRLARLSNCEKARSGQHPRPMRLNEGL